MRCNIGDSVWTLSVAYCLSICLSVHSIRITKSITIYCQVNGLPRNCQKCPTGPKKLQYLIRNLKLCLCVVIYNNIVQCSELLKLAKISTQL